tara:strand:- start:1402 stop:1788 length:387 start_codon:yes stop_codon:yes gene_type:complete
MDFNTIKSNLELLDGLDRLNYLIDLSKKNPGVPKEYKIQSNKIIGCVSNAYLFISSFEPIAINVESDSDFVQGLLYILKLYVENKTKEEIISIDEEKLMGLLKLKNSITSQRINGFYSAIKMLKEKIQ